MEPVRTFNVIPALPEPLAGLRRVAYNLRWAWNHDAIDLFRRLDSELWETSGHNPVRMLGTVDQARLGAAAQDAGLLAHLNRVCRDLDEYLTEQSTWFRRIHGSDLDPRIAYFSAEFGVTECLQIFAGGLGVLAGDHLKSSSDLGIPLVAVGLLYQQGYFRQYLNADGWQLEAYEDNDFHTLPLVQVEDPSGSPLTIQVACPGRAVHARVWCARVGRVPLYLLDTNIPDNLRPEDRDITDQLYGGDMDMRIRQEIVLGIGGYRVLEALGQVPTVLHLNEGHAAFAALEHVRMLMRTRGLSFAEARELACAGMVFTTHTMVPAGHDYFPPDLMNRYFDRCPAEIGLARRDFLALGRKNAQDDSESFCMTTLALRLAGRTNGVARLHGQVSRRMWQVLWPGVPEDEVPITHVTNGVHFLSWISLEMKELYDRYLGPRWREEPADAAVWRRVDQISAEELWRTHERRRARLVAFARRRLESQFRQRGATQRDVESASEALNPGALTIGFARRFATYKRATLLFRDPGRLARIVGDPERPVQFIFSGKAHPRDNPGKDLICQIHRYSMDERFRGRVVFVEDYDMAVARYLLQGSDVWLNTPRRPREASGTSGMKAAANGVLNLSILDGWWDEAYDPSSEPPVGWAIGRREAYDDPEYQDDVESDALYSLLEREVVPLFYERSRDGLPRGWVVRMKSTIGRLCHQYNTHRMVGEYAERLYMPAALQFAALSEDDSARARQLARWRRRVRSDWGSVSVADAQVDGFADAAVGSLLTIRSRVRLGPLKPGDVHVQLVIGPVDARQRITDPRCIDMELVAEAEGAEHTYEATVVPARSGLHGYALRVLPSHPDLITPFMPGLITWAGTV
jgi:starch phosphorylase